ncbi:MAG TPA: putative Na+/H+ antiporter [Opitutaceae bacterium]|nr:putative Na+/H+ antiporter [Opitutaceae bacterium]
MRKTRRLGTLATATALVPALHAASAAAVADFPLPLPAYGDAGVGNLWQVLAGRVAAEPFNVFATLIFLAAIVHTFFAARIRHWAHVVEERHSARLARRAEQAGDSDNDGVPDEVSFPGQILHFLGEVEAVFGIWVIALAGAIVWFKGLDTAIHYIGAQVNYTEPLFVVVIMTLAATRPVLLLAERCLRAAAGLGGATPAAWWAALLTIGPVLGSFITEPAAMTISALLLGRQFYALQPSARLKYATLGLLFVNISVGGTLTHFAAPPVLMVAAPWKWDLAFMFVHFGWKALVGIVVANAAYFMVFRRELRALRVETSAETKPVAPVPAWITAVHVACLGFTVWMAHYPALFIGGFLFFLAFAQATAHHQDRVDLRPALLVGFFLAGLVNHGGVQGWWIEPILTRLGELPLFLGATFLTAFNDNAAITYLATLVPGFSDTLKYAVVAGAVTGGGLTVIANAPNPAGQSILARYFPEGISPLGLALGALVPTAIVGAAFVVL